MRLVRVDTEFGYAQVSPEVSVLSANEQGGSVTAVPWLAREGFIAETAVKLDRLETLLARLDREAELSKRQLNELADTVNQVHRLETFGVSLRNAREYKLDELLRCIKDVKARLDGIEGPRSAFAGLRFKAFPIIDGKLKELDAFQAKFKALERNVRLTAAFFYGALFLLVVSVLVRVL
jgi:hypothetical protein